MLRRRIVYVIALVLALMGQLLDVGYIFHFIFYAVLTLPLLGLAVSLPAMLGCRAELGVSSPRICRGESASWSLCLTSRFRLPVSRLSCRLYLTNRFTGQVSRVKSVLQGAAVEEKRRWTMETDHCGMMDLQAESLWVCDCLGLFALPVRRPEPASLMVAPLPERPGPIELPEGTGTPVPQPRGKTLFGETYELRPYREGDSLRMIHWKMTAKRDELVTREPPEDTRPLPVLTFDHFGLLAEVDRALDRLEGTSMTLLEQERPHEVRWLHPETGAVRAFRIGGERDWTNCLTAILSDPAPLRGRSILEQALDREGGGAIYQIHVTGKEVPHGEA